jgi:AcrR family transcriptional regulator
MPARLKAKVGSKARVLEGAADEFAEHGYAGARIDRIARRTRLNVRMLYYHFGSKKGLHAAVLQRIYEEAARILESTKSADNPTQAALAMYVDHLVENPRFASVLARELMDGAKHLKLLFKDRPELFAGVHAHTRNLLEGSMKAGILRHEDPALTVFSLTSSVCFLTAIRPAYATFSTSAAPTAAAWKAHLVRILFDGMRVR